MTFTPVAVAPTAMTPDAAKTVSMMLQKGGTGKTTSAVLIAHMFARLGLNVMLADAAPNASLTTTQLGFEPYGEDEQFLTITDVIKSPVAPGAAAEALVQPLDWQPRDDIPWEHGGAHRPGGSLWLLPGWASLQAEADNPQVAGSAMRLATALTGLARQFDVVIIDTDPAVGNIFAMTMLASGYVMTPVMPEPGAADGLLLQLDAIEAFTEGWNHPTTYVGALCCRYSSQRVRTHGVMLDEISAALTERFGDEENTVGMGLIFPEPIPMYSVMELAQQRRESVYLQRSPEARRIEAAYLAATLRLGRLMKLAAMDELDTYLATHPIPTPTSDTAEEDEHR